MVEAGRVVHGAVVVVERHETRQPDMGKVVKDPVQICTVVWFDAVFELGLPVPLAVEDVGDRHAHHFAYTIVREGGGEFVERRRERRCVGVEVGEYEAVPNLDLVRGQTRLGLEVVQRYGIGH